jgi:hypothetical protein
MSTSPPSLLTKLDEQAYRLLSGWNFLTVILALLLLGFLVYTIIGEAADTHPIFLARQSLAAPVRFPGGSSVYRSIQAPHGYPLTSGLGVKDPGAPSWGWGRDGDLRDIWRRAVQGPAGRDGASSAGGPGKLLTIRGKDVVEHDFGI